MSVVAKLATVHVLTAPDLQPGAWGPGSTCCNMAAKRGADACGVELPLMKANEQQAWLAGPLGQAAGWVECDAATAGQQAEQDVPTLSTFHEEPHGHITFVIGVDSAGGLLIWQAGQHNYECARIRAAYTEAQLTRVRYFTRRDATKSGG